MGAETSEAPAASLDYSALGAFKLPGGVTFSPNSSAWPTSFIPGAAIVPGSYLDSLSGVHNVRAAAYGAAGDGVTDDTAAIQAAINAGKLDGYAIHFPAGTYLVTSTLVGNEMTHLAGVGPRSIIAGNAAPLVAIDYFTGRLGTGTPDKAPSVQRLTLRPGAKNAALFLNSLSGYAWLTSAHALVRDVVIDAGSSDNSQLAPLLVSTFGYNLALDNVAIVSGASLQLSNVTGFAIVSGTVTNASKLHTEGLGIGLYAGAIAATSAGALGPGAVTITPVSTFGALNTAALVRPGMPLIIDAGSVHGTQEAATVSAVNYAGGVPVSFTCTLAGAHTAGFGITTASNQGLQLTGSLLDASSTANLYVSSIGDTIMGNTLDNPSSTSVIYKGGQGAAIIGNYIGCALATNAALAAVIIDNAADVQFLANEIVTYNAGNYGISISPTLACSRVNISHNTFGGGAAMVSVAAFGASLGAGNRFSANALHGSVTSSAINYSPTAQATSFGSTPALVCKDNLNMGNVVGVVTAPTQPATNVDCWNPYPFPVTVYIGGGSVSNIYVGGYASAPYVTYLAAGTFNLEPGERIRIAYSTFPFWQWMAH